MSTDQTNAAYSERLTPSWWVWLIAASLPLMIGVAYAAPFTLAAGLVAGVLSGVCVVFAFVATTPRIEVADGELRAGRAHIDVQLLGTATPLDRESAVLTRGRDADPRAWMLLRGWIPEAVRVDLVDPADPTPYWFVSTRRPTELVAAIERERSDERYGRMSV